MSVVKTFTEDRFWCAFLSTRESFCILILISAMSRRFSRASTVGARHISSAEQTDRRQRSWETFEMIFGILCIQSNLSSTWNNFPGVSSQPYLHQSTLNPSRPARPVRSNTMESVADLTEQFSELTVSNRRTQRRPPSTYLCHLCFKKGHYIRDCPQVGTLSWKLHSRVLVHSSTCLHVS